MTDALLANLSVLHAAATWYMTGVIWLVQVVHYPAFDRIERAQAGDFAAWNARRTGTIVLPPMLLELATALALAWRPGGPLPLAGLALLAVVWASTFLLQVPAHRRLAQRFDAAAHRRLVATNWIRTLAWSARAMLATALLLRA